jgi:hypothetical protein
MNSGRIGVRLKSSLMFEFSQHPDIAPIPVHERKLQACFANLQSGKTEAFCSHE